MHVLAWFALLLPVVIIALLGAGAVAPWRPVQRVLMWTAPLLLVVWLLLFGSLAFGQQQLCGLLGGDWFEDSSACRHEWGGNGDNSRRGPFSFVDGD